MSGSPPAARRVLVTGGGAVSPFGPGVPALLSGVRAGRAAARPMAPTGGGARRPTLAALVGDPIAPPPGASPAIASAWRRLDRVSKMAVLAVGEALSAAGLAGAGAAEGSEEAGIVLGTMTAGTAPLASNLGTMFTEGPDAVSPMLFPFTVPNAPASQCSILLGLKGPNLTLCSMEASGLAAIATAAGLIRAGGVEVMIAGGADDYPREIEAVHRALRIGARGYLPGEGACFLLLESEDHARRRGATPWCVVAGDAVTHWAGEPHRWPEIPEAAPGGLTPVGAAERLRRARRPGDGEPARARSIKDLVGESGAASAGAALVAALSIRDGATQPFLVHALGTGGPEVALLLARTARP